jgi:hypothetical protein
LLAGLAIPYDEPRISRIFDSSCQSWMFRFLINYLYRWWMLGVVPRWPNRRRRRSSSWRAPHMCNSGNSCRCSCWYTLTVFFLFFVFWIFNSLVATSSFMFIELICRNVSYFNPPGLRTESCRQRHGPHAQRNAEEIKEILSVSISGKYFTVLVERLDYAQVG